ncbi:MAG: hypothetical protein IJU58_03405, partial [Clostridia bacterium]|nr:hypothetical protein [Clostridia bacterium]
MAHTHDNLRRYLEQLSTRTTHYDIIPITETTEKDGSVRKAINKEDMFSLETVLLLQDLLAVEKQMLAALNKLNTQQTVLEQKLNNLQTQLTQMNTNVQNLQNNVRKIAESNEEIE